MRICQRLLSSALLFSAMLQAQTLEPVIFKQQLAIGSDLLVWVSESEEEPRSIGSYTVKAYAIKNPQLPFDVFIAGLVQPRDGTVEAIKSFDLNRDGDQELLVIIRSAGTGSYLSADAFDINPNGVTLIASVSGLAKDADPVSALSDNLHQPR